MRPDAHPSPSAPDDYGVEAVRRRYPRFLGAGLAIAAGVHAVLIGSYWYAESRAAEIVAEVTPIAVIIDDEFVPPVRDRPAEAPPPAAPPGPPPPSGAVTPVPDAEADMEQTIADQVELDAFDLGTPGGTGPVGSPGATDGVGPAPTPPPDLTPPDLPPPAELEVEAPPAEGPIFEVVEQAPVLIGGLEGLQGRVEYPEFARRVGVEGTVFLQFVVMPDGTVEDVTVARSPSDALSQAAVRAVQSARFEPGRQRGQAVRVRYTLPVRFALR